MNVSRSNFGSTSTPPSLINNLSPAFSKPLLTPALPYQKRNMSFTNYVPCGGPKFDPLIGDWSRYFVVPDDGTIPGCGEALQSMSTNYLTPEQVSEHH